MRLLRDGLVGPLEFSWFLVDRRRRVERTFAEPTLRQWTTPGTIGDERPLMPLRLAFAAVRAEEVGLAPDRHRSVPRCGSLEFLEPRRVHSPDPP